jgi:catechol 2,3-dioxygenase-like lactoylglutathione lyase family enzyme
MSARVFVVSLWANDLAEALHFYQNVIGLTLYSHHKGRPHFDLGGAYLVLLPGKPPVSPDTLGTRYPLVAFSLIDFEAALTRLKAHGVELPWGEEAGDGLRWVMLHDPAGNLIEIVDGGELSPARE